MSVAENTTAVTKVVATDSDTGQTLAYSIVPVASGGGADASKFVIDATTGALAFKTAPNFEAPTDALALPTSMMLRCRYQTTRAASPSKRLLSR